MCEVTLNNEKNGIEIRFAEKPSSEVLDRLKEMGFRWSNRKKIWYAKQTTERLEMANGLSIVKTNAEKRNAESEVYDLWKMTRTDCIQTDGENLSCKEIAAEIRKHFRKRFPMFKFSVTSDFDSIDAYVTSTPFEKDSDEVAELLNYMGEYVEAWKERCQYDFYGGRRYPKTSYQCEFREMTVSDLNVREQFQKSKKEWEIQEEERKEAEFKAYQLKAEQERIEYEKMEAERKRKHELVEKSVRIKDVDYFVINALEPKDRKEDWFEKYNEENAERINAQVFREVHMDKETFDMFKYMLMDNWSFIEKTGGSETQDNRIKDMKDYEVMTKEERETVEWYSVKCVAVFCDGSMQFVVDAQGYDYCRYVFLLDDETKIVPKYIQKQVVDDVELEELKAKADFVEDISTQVIEQNGWIKTWNNEKQLDYIQAMKTELYVCNFKLTARIVQQITIDELKNMMYRVLSEVENIQEQFRVADLRAGQRITIIYMSDSISSLGGMNISKVTIDSVEYGSYAQYDKAVKLIFKPEGKRKLYYGWFYKDMIVLDGWVDIPETVLFDIDCSNPGVTIKRSKFLSCDRKQYRAVEEYLKKLNVTPIINTENPAFRK